MLQARGSFRDKVGKVFNIIQVPNHNAKTVRTQTWRNAKMKDQTAERWIDGFNGFCL